MDLYLTIISIFKRTNNLYENLLKKTPASKEVNEEKALAELLAALFLQTVLLKPP